VTPLPPLRRQTTRDRLRARRSPRSSHHRLASPGADYTTTSAVNADLVYYLIHYDSTTVLTDDAVNVSAVVLADAGVNGSLVHSALSAADATCELMMTVDRQLVAILLRHVVITQCQGTYSTLSLSHTHTHTHV